MSKRGSDRDDSDVPRSETGWLDDLKRAKREGGDIGDSTTSGSDRWAKLGALSGDPEPRPPAGPPPGGRGRRRVPDEPPPPPPQRREPPSTRDSGPVRPRPESRPESGVDDRESARRLIGRRSRPEGEQDGDSDRNAAARLIGRRAQGGDTGRRSRADSDADIDRGDSGRRRAPDADLDRGDRGDSGRRRASDFDPPPRNVPDDEPPRRSAFLDRFGERGSSTRGRSDLPGEGTRSRHDLPEPSGPPTPRGKLPFTREPRPGSSVSPPGSPASPISPARGGTLRPDAPGARGRHDLPPPDEPRGIAPKLARGPGAAAAAAAAGRAAGATGTPVGMPGSPLAGMPPGPLPGAVPGPIRPTSPPSPGGRSRMAAGVQAIRGARSEVRRQLREQQRLRMWTLITMVVAVVGALPFYFVLRAATQDPVINSLDSLSVPGWALVNKTDNVTGSRWCLLDCRYRERTAESKRSITETAKVYREALLGAGWSQMTNVPGCEPTQEKDSDHSCWRRDEFTLDLSVNEPPCMSEALRKRPKIEVTPSTTPSTSESSSPSTTASSSPGADDCAGSVVQIKVFNAIDDVRLRYSPEPSPIDNLTDEDLQTASPSPTP